MVKTNIISTIYHSIYLPCSLHFCANCKHAGKPEREQAWIKNSHNLPWRYYVLTARPSYFTQITRYLWFWFQDAPVTNYLLYFLLGVGNGYHLSTFISEQRINSHSCDHFWNVWDVCCWASILPSHASIHGMSIFTYAAATIMVFFIIDIALISLLP